MSRAVAIVVLCVTAGPLAGCGWVRSYEHDRVSLTDRCASVLRLAAPYNDIDINSATAQNAGVRTITARIEATRSDVPPDRPGDRTLAVECRFDDNTLTGFRWIKGGPPPTGPSR